MAYIGNSPENIQRGRRAIYEFTSTAGQTVYTGLDDNNQTLDLLEANEQSVFLNGIRLVPTDDYTVSGDTLTLTSAASLNDHMIIETQTEVGNAVTYTRAESDARYINYDGDIVAGDLQISGEVDTGSLIVDTDVLVVDATNNRVGVGTSSPDSSLHVLSTTLPQLKIDYNGTYYSTISNNGALNVVDPGTSNKWVFLRNGTEQMRIDPSGNVGIGVLDPSTWSLGKALHIGVKENNLWGEGDYAFHMNQNAYYNGGWKYTHTDEATQYTQADGQHIWSYAGSGTANTALSWSEAMRISSTGIIYVNGDGTGGRISGDGSGGLNLQDGNGRQTFKIMSPASGSTQALTLDASGNLLVGRTSSLYSNVRAEFANTNTSTNIAAGAGSAISIQNLSTANDTYSTIYFANGAGGIDSAIYGLHEVGNGTGTGRTGSLVFATANLGGGASERMRIDSLGHMLVGQSSTTQPGVGNTTTGFGIRNDGLFFASAYQGRTGTFSRSGSDGDVLGFYRAGSRAGSIGVTTNVMTILGKDGNGGLAIQNNSFGDIIYPASNSSGGASDNAIDLGYENGRFKDLYLSGGVYLGGTGSANKLDDYEEGTWTPTFGSNQGGSNSGAVYSTQSGTYVKIGNQVMCNFRIVTTSKGTIGGSTARIFGFPFNSSATNITGKVGFNNVNVSAVDWRPRGMYGSPLLTLDYKSTASGNYAEAQATAFWLDTSECFGYISYFIS